MDFQIGVQLPECCGVEMDTAAQVQSHMTLNLQDHAKDLVQASLPGRGLGQCARLFAACRLQLESLRCVQHYTVHGNNKSANTKK